MRDQKRDLGIGNHIEQPLAHGIMLKATFKAPPLRTTQQYNKNLPKLHNIIVKNALATI